MVMNLHFARAFNVFLMMRLGLGGTQDAVIRNSGDWVMVESFRIPFYKMTRSVGRGQ